MWNFLKFNFEARFLPQARRFSAGALQKNISFSRLPVRFFALNMR